MVPHLIAWFAKHARWLPFYPAPGPAEPDTLFRLLRGGTRTIRGDSDNIGHSHRQYRPPTGRWAF